MCVYSVWKHTLKTKMWRHTDNNRGTSKEEKQCQRKWNYICPIKRSTHFAFEYLLVWLRYSPFCYPFHYRFLSCVLNKSSRTIFRLSHTHTHKHFGKLIKTISKSKRRKSERVCEKLKSTAKITCANFNECVALLFVGLFWFRFFLSLVHAKSSRYHHRNGYVSIWIH